MHTTAARRDWVPSACEDHVQKLAAGYAAASSDALEAELVRLAEANRATHERDCINLNPATNILNPKAERMLAMSLGNRPSLGYPGDKYEMGLEHIEAIEVMCQQLASEVFGARFVEYRVASGAMANLYAFMATCKPGDAIIVPPASVGGHVTHQDAGAAGLYGLNIHEAKADPSAYSVDVAALKEQARRVRPKLITIGCSLNLRPHPIRDIRAIADEVGAKVLFDAAHMSGMIAGRAWQQPLAEGAHLMTMSTYKSLGGPAAGLVLTNEPDLAKRLDAIAYPGLTANFDVAKTAALAMTLLDWREHGRAYGAAMAATAKVLAVALAEAGNAGAWRGPRLYVVAGARPGSGPLRRRARGGQAAQTGEHSLLRHRPSHRGNRGRHQRPPAGFARDRAHRHGPRAHARAGGPDHAGADRQRGARAGGRSRHRHAPPVCRDAVRAVSPGAGREP